MQPALCAAIDYAIPFDQVLPLIRTAGFEVISLEAQPAHSGYDTADGRVRIQQMTNQLGLRINSIHAPFPEGDQLCSLDDQARNEALRQCLMAFEAAHELGIGIVVIHLNTHPDLITLQQMMDQANRSMSVLTARAEAWGIQIAVENSWGEPYMMMLDHVMAAFPETPVGFCYDSGHENINHAGFRDLKRYGPRLITLHLHDNCGDDAHMLPYEGNIDWPHLMALLRDFNYSGDLLLEACIERSAIKEPVAFLTEAWHRALRLLEKP